MKTKIFTGAATALVTPFTENGIDYENFGRLIDMQIEQGINALVICGTTGEASTMPDEEHLAVLKFAIDKIAKRVPVICGTGSNDTLHGIELCKEAEALGADALLCVTPYYNKTTQEGLYQHFKAMADAVSIPMILYNVPTRTGINLAPTTIARLAEIDNIVAVKECNLTQMADVRRLTPEDFSIYSGNDDQIPYNLVMGGSGVISVLSNIAPAYVVEMIEKFFAGDVAGCRKMQLDAIPLCNALFSEVNPIPAKAAVEMMGYCNGIVRMPLVPISEKNREILYAEMKNFGLIH